MLGEAKLCPDTGAGNYVKELISAVVVRCHQSFSSQNPYLILLSQVPLNKLGKNYDTNYSMDETNHLMPPQTEAQVRANTLSDGAIEPATTSK